MIGMVQDSKSGGGLFSRSTLVILGALALLVAGGMIYLMTADIPAPSQPVTKTLNNDRFPS